MAHEFKVVRRVEFAETDLAGIVHFSNFFRYMESAEQAFIRSLGFSIHTTDNGKTVGWPRVHAECDYRRPLHFEDEVEIRLQVRKIGRKSIQYAFTFRNLNDRPEEIVAEGALTVVYVAHSKGQGGMKAVRIPPALLEKIEAAPAFRTKNASPAKVRAPVAVVLPPLRRGGRGSRPSTKSRIR